MNENQSPWQTLWGEILFLVKWLLISGCVGICVGIVGTAFHYSIVMATNFRIGHHWILYTLPIGGIVIAVLYKAFGREKDGGTNSVLTAVRLRDGLPIITAPLVFAGTVITHLCGGSSGREGAALQLGGSIASCLGRVIHLRETDRDIITMCGMSAGFAALFGTPVTAAVFALEVTNVGVMHYSAIVPAIISAAVGAMVAKGFGIVPETFHLLGVPEFSGAIYIRVIILAALCAGVSVVFCQMIKRVHHAYDKYIPNKILCAAIGGAIVVVLTMAVGTGDYNGAGMQVIERAIDGSAKPEAFILKMMFTALTLGAGFKGGEIVPALFCGATFGNTASKYLGISPSFGSGIGMVALFCGVTNCPITSIFLGIEMFGGSGILFLATSAAVAYSLSGYYSLYSEQKIIYSKKMTERVDKKTI